MQLKRIALELRSSQSRLSRYSGYGLSAVYRSLTLYVLGCDIPTSTRIDGPIVIHHPIGLVISDDAHLGTGVQLRQSTTIGSRHPGGPAPRICDGADIGANSVLLGGIRVGEGAIVGAGSVVLADVEDGQIVAGNPARPIRSSGSRTG